MIPLDCTGPCRNELTMALVEAGEVSGAEWHGRAEEEAETPAVSVAPQRSDRRVDLWSSYSSHDISVCIKLVHDRRVIGCGQRGRWWRRRASHDPIIECMDRGIKRPVGSAGVDGHGTVEPAHGRTRGVLHRRKVLYGALSVAGVTRTDGKAVIVIVRAACDLPESEPLWIAVMQSVGQLAVGDIGFGLELENRNSDVAPYRGRIRRCVVGLRRLGQRSTGTA